MPRLFPDDDVVPFTALHRRHDVDAALSGVGCTTPARMLHLPRPVLYDAWHTLNRPQVPRSWGADLVHAPSLAVPPGTKTPLVVTVHDAAPELFPEAFPARGLRFHRQGLDAAARRADLIIAVSQSAADEIVANSEIPAERIRVVLNGVSAPVIGQEHRYAVLGALGLFDRPYVLWVGSLEPRKGVATLLSAVLQLVRRGGTGDFLLVLAGYDGWLSADLLPEADRAELGPSRLLQLGRLSEDELWALYGGATVFAFPSNHEGFGLPVVEAMSQGVPVLASDIAALREVTAGAARLVPRGDVSGWADALGGLLRSQEDRHALAAAGLARSAELTVEAMVSGVRAVYREVTGR